MQRQMRYLRQKHGITVMELADCSEVNRQRMTQIELGMGTATKHTSKLVEAAFLRLILLRRKQLAELESDFIQHRKNLLDFVEDGGDEP